MILNDDGNKPIYIQIAEWIEIGILNGHLAKNERVYSQYQLADMFNINPATAAKGLTKLAEEGIIYDKRGVGRFVSGKARDMIVDKRKNQTVKKLMEDLIQEVDRLEMTEREWVDLLQEMKNKSKGAGK